MIRLTVMYPQSAGSSFDWSYYPKTHFALVHKCLRTKGLLRFEVDKGVGSFPPGTPAPYHAMAHMFFQSIAELASALSTSQELVEDQKNYFSGQSVIQISEVIEV